MRHIGPVSGRHYLFAVGVFLTAVLSGVAFDAWQKPRYAKPSSIAEAERIIEDALKIRRPGHRWDVVDVTVSACEIRTFKHDRDCVSPTMLQTREIVYDLRKMSLATDFREPFVRDGIRTQHIDASPRREFEEQMRHIKSRSRKLIDEARAEVGWGHEAAVLKSERFKAQFPEAEIPAWRRTHVCNGDVYFDVHEWSFVFLLPDLEARDALLGAVQVLERHCGSIKNI